MRLAAIPAAVAILAFIVTPALAQQKKPRTVPPPPSYAPQWSGRPDPSFGNRIGIDNECASGRCVVDLGYGRWENF